MRKLVFHSNLGYVNLALHFNNGSFDFKCSPMHAVLISYFDETSNKIFYSQNMMSKTGFPQSFCHIRLVCLKTKLNKRWLFGYTKEL